MKSIAILFGGTLSEHELLSVAATGRLYDLSKIMRAAGYKPIILGFARDRSFQKDTPEYALYIIKKPLAAGCKKIRNFLGVNNALKTALSDIIQQHQVIALLYQSAFARLIFPTVPLAKKHNLSLGVIANDWYEYSGRKLFYCETELTWKWIYPRFSNFIVTSTYFQRYFGSKGTKNILYIPGVFDSSTIPFGREATLPSDPKVPIRIAYAGNMQSQKDRTDLVIQALVELKRELPETNLELHIYGNEEGEVKSILGEDARLIDSLGSSLCFHGFVAREKLQHELQQMDFTILMRPNKRYAEAGFATKFSESFLLGVPVIANLTGDIKYYLQDGKNGLVVQKCSISAIKDTLARAVCLPPDTRKSMRAAALETGTNHFTLSPYVDGMRSFIENMENQ